MREQLKRDAVCGVGWAFFSATSVRILQVITTLTLAKLLMPADFGIFALATLIISAVTIFRDVGFAQVLIYQQGDVRKTADTAFTLSLLSSLFLAGLLFAWAPVLGGLFSTPTIIWPVRVMSFGVLVSGAANIHFAMLDKQLKFRMRAVPEVAGAFVYAAISIGLAIAGHGAWSLVIGWLALNVVSTTAVWIVSPWRPRLAFDRAEARVIVGYGKHLMVASLATFAFFQVDNASIGKWLGVTALGFYSMAFTVCNLPATNLAHVVNRVMFPTYSRLQDDLSGMREVYLRAVKYISMAAFPAAVGILVVAGPAIRALYGDKWVPAIPLFHILAFYGLARSIGSTANAVFMSTGRPWLVQRVSTLQLLVAVPLVYPVALRWGTVGVAVLFSSAYLIGMAYGVTRVQGILKIPLSSYARILSLPSGAAALAGVFGWLISFGLGGVLWIEVVATGAILGSVYGVSIFLLDRGAYREILRLLSGSGGYQDK